MINGYSNIYKRVISSADVVPFFTLTLPDPDVLKIDSIILLEGTNYNSDPTNAEFNNPDNKYYEVDYLAEQRVFVEDYANSAPSNPIKAATWLDVTRKFIKEFTANGYCKLTFGSGDSNDAFQ